MFGSKFFQVLALAAAVISPISAVETQQSQSVTPFPLIGEWPINEFTATAFADAFVAEAFAIWDSTGWRVISNTDGVLNEAKPVSGVFAASGVDLTRAQAIVDVEAQKLFDLLITPKGYQLIDPASNPEDFSKPPLARYSTQNWRGIGNADKKYLKIDQARVELPGITKRQFLVYNQVDQLTRIFVSKSIQHESIPGCSKYGGACYNASAVPIRVLNTFAVEVQPLATNASQSVVRLINYADLVGPEVPKEMMNAINAPFLVDMINRMRVAFP
jgi:hypothetical protein